ncbi:MAG: HdeD family acid-resistance protein [Candidatus Saccharimonadales bacterium]
MAKHQIKKLTKKIWNSIIIGGVVSIVFGLLAMIWTGITLDALVVVFGIFMVVMGIVWLMESLTSIKSDPLWWLGLLFAILAGAGGVYLLCNPTMLIGIFIVLLAIYVFVQSLIDLIIASYTENTSDKLMWIILGLLGIAFGIIVVVHPAEASFAFIWVLGLYALIRGTLSILFAIRARKYLKKATKSKKKK